MKIIFVIDDHIRCFNEYQATGVLVNPRIRTVEIDLMPYQIDAIKLNKNLPEDYISIALKLDE